MENALLVSVVIATKNEEKNIENCIKSVLEQAYPKDKIEIIVVDNNSDDKTKEIARKYTDKVFDIAKEINLEKIKNFRGAQVNLGVEKSSGDIIFFPDADMTFDADLLSDAVLKLKDSDALFVPEIVCGKGLFGEIRNFERSFYNQTCIDGTRFAKRDVFEKIGGFDIMNIMFGPDDWDFTKTLKNFGCKLDITEKSLYHHEEWLDWKTYINKKGNYVKTMEGYMQKWGKNDPDIKKQLGLWYRYSRVFFENGKWKKLFLHPILALGMYLLRFLVGVNFLIKK